MNIEIINLSDNISPQFLKWIKTDLVCPECGMQGMVIKYRCNGKIGFFHTTSGILLSCENWHKCKSWWNKENPYEFPWHTWLGSHHIPLDIERGRHGLNFLNKLNVEYEGVYNRLKKIDNEITLMCQKGSLNLPKPQQPKKIQTDFSGNSTLKNF